MTARKGTTGKGAKAPEPAKRRTVKHLAATEAEIGAWFASMVEADQPPAIVDFGTRADGRSGEQIMCGGRLYDHARDADRWWWMRDHQADVMAWLRAKALVYVIAPGGAA